MTATRTRVWTGTVQSPTWGVDLDACKCTTECRCPNTVDLPLRTDDGRTIVARLSPEDAEQLARQLMAQAEMARAMNR